MSWLQRLALAIDLTQLDTFGKIICEYHIHRLKQNKRTNDNKVSNIQFDLPAIIGSVQLLRDEIVVPTPCSSSPPRSRPLVQDPLRCLVHQTERREQNIQ